jgi:tetratricopeptide (TPR) repeat protein
LKICHWQLKARAVAATAVFLGAVLAGRPVCAQSTPVPAAAARLRIEKLAQTDWPAKVGVVELAPNPVGAGRFGVFGADGKPVAFQTVWSAAGEPTRVCFDTSGGATVFYVCFGDNLPSASGSWKPEAGVLLETRACRADLPINTVQQIERVINTAGPAMGHDYVPNIFLGVNPFGPSSNYMAMFSGWFTAPAAGQYTFATASVDASSLEVDGRSVASWLGMHGAGGGTHGEHSGTITLAAGPHLLGYVQIQLGGVAAAVAAWKPPGRDQLAVMPATAFAPVARFRATRFEWASPGLERLYFEWNTVEQCALDESLFVRVQFRAVDNSERRTYRWHFDDGSEETGANVRHFFAAPGQRQVSVEALQNGVVVATNSVRVRVAPDWKEIQWWREGVFNQAKSDFLRRDLSPMPARDLVAVWEMADRADDPELVMGAGGILVQRQSEFNTPGYAAVFYKTGLAFEHQGDSGDTLAEKSLRLALSPQRASPATSDRAKLHLAALLIHCSGDLDEAAKMLGGISANLLNGDEKRLLRLLQGDLLLARGKTDDARKLYAAAGDRQAGAQPGVTRAARLESAAILIEHSRWDEAQAALDRLELDTPLERMLLDAELPALSLDMGRKEYRRAFTDGQALLAAAGDDPRQSEVLYTVIESGLALGKNEQAQRALERLLKDFPYSESAAKAKDRWSRK